MEEVANRNSLKILLELSLLQYLQWGKQAPQWEVMIKKPQVVSLLQTVAAIALALRIFRQLYRTIITAAH
jgi:hypothetical protein